MREPRRLESPSSGQVVAAASQRAFQASSATGFQPRSQAANSGMNFSRQAAREN